MFVPLVYGSQWFSVSVSLNGAVCTVDASVVICRMLCTVETWTLLQIPPYLAVTWWVSRWVVKCALTCFSWHLCLVVRTRMWTLFLRAPLHMRCSPICSPLRPSTRGCNGCEIQFDVQGVSFSDWW